MNTASIIYDNNNAEECFKLSSYENSQNGVKVLLKLNKRQDVTKSNRRHHHLQKISY